MEFMHVFWLAILQGLTEFLPISSSAHLILLPQLLGWPDQGLAFDVSVHVGTLSAVIFYFRKSLVELVNDGVRSLIERKTVGESRLAWGVVLGTIPVGLAGLAFGSVIETQARSLTVIATTTILFGLLLGWADIKGKRERSERTLTWMDVCIIGVAQAVALIPGTSRSGITMTAGLMLGLTREAAARYSFLLSIPVIVLAGGLETLKLLGTPTEVDWQVLTLGALISGVSAYACIFGFLRLLERIGMMPFVIYRLLLGGVLFWFSI